MSIFRIRPPGAYDRCAVAPEYLIDWLRRIVDLRSLYLLHALRLGLDSAIRTDGQKIVRRVLPPLLRIAGPLRRIACRHGAAQRWIGGLGHCNRYA